MCSAGRVRLLAERAAYGECAYGRTMQQTVQLAIAFSPASDEEAPAVSVEPLLQTAAAEEAHTERYSKDARVYRRIGE